MLSINTTQSCRPCQLFCAIAWRFNYKFEVPGENYQPTTSQTLSHMVVLKDTSSGVTIRLTTLVVTGIDCIGSCKSNYHMITVMEANEVYKYTGN
jgi:hypothetical protein